MSSRKSFVVTFDLGAAEDLGDKIAALSSKALVRLSAVDAVNDVATRADATLRAGMNRGINLTDDYVRERVTVARAVDTPVAEIVASGSLTILTDFPYVQLSQPARGGFHNRKVRPAKGDPSRGIAPGRKQAGVAVEVTRGAAVDGSKWFLMRLRGQGNRMGVFVRPGKGKAIHLYGPAPYSLFRFQVDAQQEEIADDLQRTGTQRAADAIDKALR